MALTQLRTPFPSFTDLDGSPLDAGYLYFGEVSQNPETSPITVYYDAALTQPATQPLRTSNGYVVRNGSPAVLFANSGYSITVRDKNKRLVLSSLSDNDTLSGALLSANNLSDVSSAATSLVNLGLTATAAELNLLDGVTATTTELNHIDGVTSAIQTQLDALDTGKADLASPALTGTPTAPTAAADTNTTQIATTAFVQRERRLVQIDQQSISGTPTNVDFTFAPADYDHVYLDFSSVRSGTNGVQLCLRVFDSGGSIDAGAFDYGYNVISDRLGADIQGTGLGADAEIQMMPDYGIHDAAADDGAFGTIKWHQCYKAQHPSFSFDLGYYLDTNVFVTAKGHGKRKASGTYTGFRLFFLGAETFAEGDFTLWGVKA